MSHHTETFMLAVTVIISCIVIAAAFFVERSGISVFNESSNNLTKSVQDLQNTIVTRYNNKIVTGSEVQQAVTGFHGKLTFLIATGEHPEGFYNTDLIGDSGSIFSINSSAMFKSTLHYNEGSQLDGIIFTQKGVMEPVFDYVQASLTLSGVELDQNIADLQYELFDFYAQKKDLVYTVSALKAQRDALQILNGNSADTLTQKKQKLRETITKETEKTRQLEKQMEECTSKLSGLQMQQTQLEAEISTYRGKE